MVKLYEGGAYYVSDSREIISESEAEYILNQNGIHITKAEAKKNTMAYSILQNHNSSQEDGLKIKFDSLASHDITYVSIVQTARASGLVKFPMPYILTNCHNTLCAVGGTINEDDHIFGLSAARKYGGIYVPTHQAVIHQYMREEMASCGKMILGSDSHTRYGALGTLAIGEGGGELVKQLLGKTYDIDMPDVVGVYLDGEPQRGVGPQDVALAIISAVFENGYVKNKVMEFVGNGIKKLSVDFRNGIDVMTTETTCLSSIWETDSSVREYYETHGRADDYKELKPSGACYYDGMIYIDLSKIKPMIAMPFHPSNVYAIDELNQNLEDIIDKVEKTAAEQLDNKTAFKLRDKIKNSGFYVDQGVIAGCAGGTFENICHVADILKNASIGNGEFSLSVYPASQPIFMSIVENGAASGLMSAGATIRSAFCGPCFGAGDVPCNNGISIRHTTRNFPSREGSKPANGQIASVALMDARSVAATALNKGRLTAATDVSAGFSKPKYFFNKTAYDGRVYNGYGKADSSEELKLAPSIRDWPKMPALAENILLVTAAFITDPVTTTDELIPSGETSSYRSNPMGLAEYTLSRKIPDYVGKAKKVQLSEAERQDAGLTGISDEKTREAFNAAMDKFSISRDQTGIGSVIYAVKPGDGSAREQAASCQRVLGGFANIAREYATKRYRSNLINWGIIPFIIEDAPLFGTDDYIFVPGIRKIIQEGHKCADAYLYRSSGFEKFKLSIPDMTKDERDTLLAGCLINYYAQK